MGTRQRKSPPVLDTPAGGATSQRRGLVVSNIVPQTPHAVKRQSLTGNLADLRKAYQTAILGKRWAEAARLQRRYHQVERQRRRELLQQAAARGRRHE